MITIKNTSFTSDLPLSSILVTQTKVKVLKVVEKLGLYVSPNLKKEETVRRAARELLDNPTAILDDLCRNELKLVNEFVQAGPNTYVVRKMRKIPYKLQKYGLVLTYEDFDADQWHMLMPDSVRLSLSRFIDSYMEAIDKQRPTAPKETISSETLVKDLPPYVEIITKYSLKGQATILLTLAYINNGLGNLLPIAQGEEYDTHLQSLIHAIINKRADEELQTAIGDVLNDLRSAIDFFPDLLDGIQANKYPLALYQEQVLTYGSMFEALYKILVIMRSKTADELNALLSDVTFNEDLPAFLSIEPIAEQIVNECLESMIESFGPYLSKS